MAYYKITNAEENHHGFQYVDGLNVLDKPFQMNGSCVKGGLYFTTLEFIPHFYGYGIYLREVELPTSDPEFQMVKDPDGDKWRANKIILGKKYSLFDYDTYQKLGLDPIKNTHLVNYASKYNRVDTLQWWYNYVSSNISQGENMDHLYNESAINSASKFGWIDVLNWWLTHSQQPGPSETKKGIYQIQKIKFKYDSSSMDLASENNQVEVLNWWLNKSEYVNEDYQRRKSKISDSYADLDKMVMLIKLRGYILFHDKSVLPLEYTDKAIQDACRNGHIEVLDWWFENSNKYGFELKYDHQAFIDATVNGRIDVLNWWLNKQRTRGLPMKYTNWVIYYAAINQQFEAIEWWLNSELYINGVDDVIHFAAESTDKPDILYWWNNYKVAHPNVKLV